MAADDRAEIHRRVPHRHPRQHTCLLGRGDPAERVEEISPQAQFEQWWAATLATDPEGARRTPPVLRSPNGVLKDFAEIWAAGNTTYDPARIRAATLLVVGEWDATTPPAMALALFGKLTNAAQRRIVILSEGTHFIALEKNRMHLIHEVQGFLDEGPRRCLKPH